MFLAWVSATALAAAGLAWPTSWLSIAILSDVEPAVLFTESAAVVTPACIAWTLAK